MAKLVEIDACVECPNYVENDANQSLTVGDTHYVGYIPYCCLESQNIEEYEGDFPDWCPLEDATDE